MTSPLRAFKSEKFDTTTFRFEPFEIRFASWKPGCYEQLSYGLHRYLYVDDEGVLHNVDRWTAIHAELNRVNHSGLAINPLSWSSEHPGLFCEAWTQLPFMWARAAAMCSGLLPVRHVLDDGRWLYEYRGVPLTTYARISRTLGYERLQNAPTGQKVG